MLFRLFIDDVYFQCGILAVYTILIEKLLNFHNREARDMHGFQKKLA